MKTAEYWIRKLKLKKHPEGGYYREIYKSSEKVSTPRGKRAASTAIYFLLRDSEFSALHRIASDEVWHFYAGDDLTVWMLDPKNGKLRKHALGFKAGCFSAIVPAGQWFGASLNRRIGYALVGCTVAPGFDFQDFELAERKKLLEKFPKQQSLIQKLTSI